MSDLAMFDTLAYAKKLKAAGFTEEQLATKQDICNIRRDMKEMEMRLKHDLTLRLGVMLAACMAIIATIVKLIG